MRTNKELLNLLNTIDYDKKLAIYSGIAVCLVNTQADFKDYMNKLGSKKPAMILDTLAYELNEVAIVEADAVVSKKGKNIPPPPTPPKEIIIDERNEIIDDEENTSLEEIKARTNFNETAFFFPHLSTDSKGNVSIKFTIPESLTKWKFMALAHTTDLKTGSSVCILLQPNLDSTSTQYYHVACPANNIIYQTLFL